MSTYEDQLASPQLPTAVPPNPPRVMPSVAAANNVDVDVVEAGGAETMSRPTGERELRGPLAESVAERLTGSAQAVDAAGERVTQRGDAPANERINGGPA